MVTTTIANLVKEKLTMRAGFLTTHGSVNVS